MKISLALSLLRSELFYNPIRKNISDDIDMHLHLIPHLCACTAIETLLHELTGLPVEEHCNRGERQSCCFTVKIPERKETVF